MRYLTSIPPALSLLAMTFVSVDGYGLAGELTLWSNQAGPYFVRDVQGLAVERQFGDLVFAGSRGALFKSVDGGGSWITYPLPIDVSCIEMDPLDTERVYVAASNEPLFYRSFDQGASWEITLIPIPSVSSLAIAPSQTTRLYIGANVQGGMGAVSDDYGENWIQFTIPGMGRILSLAVDPDDPNRVFAGGDLGICTSSDGGVTWVPSSVPASYTDIQMLQFHPEDRQQIISASGSAMGSYRSQDGGVSWQLTEGIGFDRFFAGDFAAWDTNQFLIGGDQLSLAAAWDVFSWSPVFWEDSAEALRTSENHRVFIGTRHDGIFRSLDAGLTFEPVNANLPFADMRDVALVPNNPHRAFAVGWSGRISRSTDGGLNWQQVGQSGHWNSVAVSPSQPNVVYVCGDSIPAMKSSDGGDTWTFVSQGFSGTTNQMIEIAVDPLNPDHALVMSHAGSNHLLYQTHNGGSSWEPVGIPVGSANGRHEIVFDPQNPDRILVAHDLGSLRSLNGGVSWQLASSIRVKQINGIFEPGGSLLYGVFGENIVMSPDWGLTWLPIIESPANEPLTLLHVAPSDSNVMTLISSSGRVMMTDDGGVQWFQSPDAVCSGDLRAISVEPNTGIRFVAAADRSIYRFMCSAYDRDRERAAWPDSTVTQMVERINYCPAD
ncbi:MAG: hypothetical protein KDC35_05825 [Acidobacteria bacterium]|nr:hypothetical protein [Acidobacteriota bacterium]